MLREENSFLFLLGNENGVFPRGTYSGYKYVVVDYIELLLVIAGCVGGACEATPVRLVRVARQM